MPYFLFRKTLRVLAYSIFFSAAAFADEDEESRLLQQAVHNMRVSNLDTLAKVLETELRQEPQFNQSMRMLLMVRSSDRSVLDLQRNAILVLARRPTRENIVALTKSISHYNPLTFISSEFTWGALELKYPCVHELRATVGEPAVEPILEYVTKRRATDSRGALPVIDLELLAYTALSIRSPDSRRTGAKVPSEVIEQLEKELDSLHDKDGKRRAEDVERFKGFLRTVQPILYRFPRKYQEGGFQVPPESVLLHLDEETQELRFRTESQ